MLILVLVRVTPFDVSLIKVSPVPCIVTSFPLLQLTKILRYINGFVAREHHSPNLDRARVLISTMYDGSCSKLIFLDKSKPSPKSGKVASSRAIAASCQALLCPDTNTRKTQRKHAAFHGAALRDTLSVSPRHPTTASHHSYLAY
jgi:hypothetical protein